MLTRGRVNRRVKTPGGRLTLHRRKNYTSRGTCALTGKRMQLPKKAKLGESQNASGSAKRSNRPYGGYARAKAVRRGIIRAIRE